MSLQSLTYPGRMIGLGQTADGRGQIVVYLLTGRSPASQARRIVQTPEGHFKTQVTDPALLQQGILALLLYECIHFSTSGTLVSNGAQTEHLKDIDRTLPQAASALSLLTEAYQTIPNIDLPEQAGIDLRLFEPDSPHYTPRICGAIRGQTAALSVVKAIDEQPSFACFALPMLPGTLHWVSTYQGPQNNPLPSFQGEPHMLKHSYTSAEALGTQLLEQLAPRPNQPDLRVSMVVHMTHAQHPPDVFLWNRHPAPSAA